MLNRNGGMNILVLFLILWRKHLLSLNMMLIITDSTEILVFKYHSSIKRTKLLGKVVDFRAEMGKIKDKPKEFCGAKK